MIGDAVHLVVRDHHADAACGGGVHEAVERLGPQERVFSGQKEDVEIAALDQHAADGAVGVAVVLGKADAHHTAQRVTTHSTTGTVAMPSAVDTVTPAVISSCPTS